MNLMNKNNAPPLLACPFCGCDFVLALWDDKPKKVTYPSVRSAEQEDQKLKALHQML